VQALRDQRSVRHLTFAVTNGGSKVTEFYLYGEDGKRIVGEVENIGPALPGAGAEGRARKLHHRMQAGMIGDGIRAPFSVSDTERAAGISARHASW
jgi:iron uptake system component EfeO